MTDANYPHVSLLEAILTQSTCGESCWHAREDICRCSCGGKNHGCLRDGNGDRPVRSAKIDGDRYTLSMVGSYDNYHEIASETRRINESFGPREVFTYGYGNSIDYPWRETDKHAPARLKPASKDQIAKWPELSAFRDLPPYRSVYLLWVKETVK